MAKTKLSRKRINVRARDNYAHRVITKFITKEANALAEMEGYLVPRHWADRKTKAELEQYKQNAYRKALQVRKATYAEYFQHDKTKEKFNSFDLREIKKANARLFKKERKKIMAKLSSGEYGKVQARNMLKTYKSNFGFGKVEAFESKNWQGTPSLRNSQLLRKKFAETRSANQVLNHFKKIGITSQAEATKYGDGRDWHWNSLTQEQRDLYTQEGEARKIFNNGWDWVENQKKIRLGQDYYRAQYGRSASPTVARNILNKTGQAPSPKAFFKFIKVIIKK